MVFVGAGGIVNDAHLPAYRALDLPIAGVFDEDPGRAQATCETNALPSAFESLAEACALEDVIFDIAVPPGAVFDVIDQLPDRAACLIQKPLGLGLEDATRIRDRANEKNLVAAVNLQLRFSPAMLALHDLVERGLLGRLVDCEVQVHCKTPWQLWPFLQELEHVEVAMHSIHYIDCIRSFLGDPAGVWARTVRHPDVEQLHSSKTSAILEYGDELRCSLSTNHHHAHGQRHEVSNLRLEGTDGAAVVQLGVNLDYPKGRPDSLEIALKGSEWTSVELQGSWFPDAFRGPMANLQRFVAGDDERLWTSIDDAWNTMAVVEACYESSARGMTPIPAARSTEGDAS